MSNDKQNNKQKKDATELLAADHREVEELFKKFEEAKESGDTNERYKIAREVCAQLLVHMEVEEKVFYPAARKVIEKKELLDEALVEHNGAKTVIAEIGTTAIGSKMFDAKVKVLSEQIEHHVEEEENELFPLLREAEIDLHELGKAIAEQKDQLLRQHNMAPSE